MINDFYGDNTCKAHYRFESDLINIDSKSVNHLTNVNAVTSSDCKEGFHSALLSSAYFFIPDSELSDDFPLKWIEDEDERSEYVPIISVCFWMRPAVTTGIQTVVAKYDPLGRRSFRVYLDDGGIYVGWGYGGGSNEFTVVPGVTLNVGTWYHVGVSLSDAEHIAHVRVWDDSTQQIICNYLEELIVLPLSITDANFTIGADHGGNNKFTGRIDELVVFNTYKKPPEIDAIRKQIYTGPIVINSFYDDPTVVSLYTFEDDTDIFKDYFGSNSLTGYSLPGYDPIYCDTSHYKEGLKSVRLKPSLRQYASINDTDLSSNFPLKSQGVCKMTLCVWFRINSVHDSDVICKTYDEDGGRSFAIRIDGATLRCVFGLWGGESYDTFTVGSLTLKRWYHLSVVIDQVSFAVIIQLFDGAQYRVVKTIVSFLTGHLHLSTAPFTIGRRNGTDYYFDGWVDEVVIFHDLKTLHEIELIRASTYHRRLKESYVCSVGPQVIYGLEPPGRSVCSVGTQSLYSPNDTFNVCAAGLYVLYRPVNRFISNNFFKDPNCVACYSFEQTPGLAIDHIGGNTLTVHGPVEQVQ